MPKTERVCMRNRQGVESADPLARWTRLTPAEDVYLDAYVCSPKDRS